MARHLAQSHNASHQNSGKEIPSVIFVVRLRKRYGSLMQVLRVSPKLREAGRLKVRYEQGKRLGALVAVLAT
jgi:hypothetical protein